MVEFSQPKKNALGTSYGRPVGGTEPSAFVDEGAVTVRPKHLEKVREGEEEKEEEETNEMLFHHKPRPAAEGPAPVSPNVLIEYFFLGGFGQTSRLHTSLSCLCVWGSFASNSMHMDVPQALEVPKPSLCQSVDEI